jgi:hypothetical protein
MGALRCAQGVLPIRLAGFAAVGKVTIQSRSTSRNTNLDDAGLQQLAAITK